MLTFFAELAHFRGKIPQNIKNGALVCTKRNKK